MQPFITVVIPTLNEAGYLAQCIESLMRDPYPRDRLEVLIVDGGSTDRTLAIVGDLATRYPICTLSNPKRRQAAAFNLAMTQASNADLLLRCDAHALYPANIITMAATSLAEHTDADVAVYCDAPLGVTCFQKAVAFAQNTPIGVGGSHYRLGGYSGFVDHGKHGCFRRAAVAAVGGYDETFSHNEDSELSYRLTQNGNRIWLDERLTVGYYPRSTPQELARQYWLYGRGRRRTAAKHHMRLKPRQIAPIMLAVLTPPIWFAAFWVLWPMLFWIAMYLTPILVLSGAVAVKRKSPCILLASIAIPIMHHAFGVGYLCQWLSEKVGAFSSSN